jgi:hypothetical protein
MGSRWFVGEEKWLRLFSFLDDEGARGGNGTRRCLSRRMAAAAW